MERAAQVDELQSLQSLQSLGGALGGVASRVAAEYGFTFPVGLDEHWRTIDSWWLDSGERAATSATLLVDRRGIIRWVHPGPEYHPGGPADHERCRSDFADLRAAALQ